MAKAMCLNCGRNETDLTVCDQCRASFPGSPAMLAEMVKMFESMRGSVLLSRAPGTGEPLPPSGRKPRRKR